MNDPLQQSQIDKVDQKLSENEKNLMTMQNCLQSKRMQIFELQNFLIKEFQNIEVWGEQKQRVSSLVKNQIKFVLQDMKALLTNVIKQTHQIAYSIVMGVAKAYQIKVEQLQRDIKQRDNRISEQFTMIQSMKNTNSRSPSFSNLRQTPRQFSQNRQNQVCKSLSKSNFLDFHMSRLKSRQNKKDNTNRHQNNEYQLEKQEIRTQKSSYAQKSDKSLRSYKNFCQQENKIVRSPLKKKITYQIQRIEKEETQNKCQMEHKKYVKQKIESLKSRNSGIFNECKPLKMQRRF